jgi:hypothetical protein
MVQITLKRRFPRVEYVTPMLVKRIGGRAEEHEQITRTQVLGLGGCMFTSESMLGMNSILALLITVRGRVLRTKARVAWERRSPREVEVGVEFLHLDLGDRALLETVVPA